jgi:hypothetical protein
MKKLVLAIAILVNTSISISQTLSSELDGLSLAFKRDSALTIKEGDDDTKLMGRLNFFLADVKVREEFLKHNPKIGRLSVGFDGEKFILIKDWVKLYDFNALTEKIQDSVYRTKYEFSYVADPGDTLAYGSERVYIYDSKSYLLKSFTIHFSVDLTKTNPIYNIRTILINDSEFLREMGLY